MAEYCKECSRKNLGIPEYKLDNAEFSEEPELCEGCGEYHPVLVSLKPPSLMNQLAADIKKLFHKRF